MTVNRWGVYMLYGCSDKQKAHTRLGSLQLWLLCYVTKAGEKPGYKLD